MTDMDTKSSKYGHKIAPLCMAGIAVSVLAMVLFLLYGHDWLRQRVVEYIYDTYPNPEKLIEAFQKDKSFVGNAVWTLTTLIPPFITLYYTLLGSRNYGLTNRRIIAYTVGSLFIPVLVILNGVVVAVMTWMYYTDSCTFFYVVAIYSCLLQASLIGVCLSCTTRIAARHAIRKIEKRQMKDLHRFLKPLQPKSAQDDSEQDRRDRRKLIDGRMGQAVFHLDSALRWEEPFSEKRDVILLILNQPFDRCFEKKSGSVCLLYEYIYKNFQLLARNAKRMTDRDERTYDKAEREGVYGVIKECFCYADMKYGKSEKNREQVFYREVSKVYFGAFANAFIPESALWDRWGIFAYILNMSVIDNKLKRSLTREFILALLFNLYTGRLRTDDAEDMKQMVLCLQDMPEIPEEFQYLKGRFQWERDLIIKELRAAGGECEFAPWEIEELDEVRGYTDRLLAWTDGVAESRKDLYNYIYRIVAYLYEETETDSVDYFMKRITERTRKDGNEYGSVV